jgi:hypothetical protein
MKFKYRKVPDNTDPRRKFTSVPILQVRLFHGSKYQDVRCLLDSGADDCLFHGPIGELLGIDVRGGMEKKYYGVGGMEVTGYLHAIQLQVQGFSEVIDLEVAFTYDHDVAILGQTGFFDSYQVIFERYKGRFQIKPRPLRGLS